jgi:hypothetical protein
MRRIICTALAAALMGTTVVASVTSASADPRRDQYIENYYRGHDRDDDYWRWRRGHGDWCGSRYRDWYRGHHRRHDDGFFDSPAAAIFGFAAGAIAVGAANAVADGARVARCEAECRSYDRSHDAFFGYDGEWHRCRL